jgi:hypothetical protein
MPSLTGSLSNLDHVPNLLDPSNAGRSRGRHWPQPHTPVRHRAVTWPPSALTWSRL